MTDEGTRSPVGRYEWGVPEVVAFLRRNIVWIVAPAVTAAVVTAVAFAFFVHRTYTASAILVIVPPAFSSELKPPTLTVQGYQQLVESDAVIHEAQDRLRGRGALADTKVLRLGVDVFTRIFVSRREETTSLAPMVQLVARGSTPDEAAEIANEWAAVSLERVGELTSRTTSVTVSFIEEQFPLARNRLAGLEENRTELATSFARRQTTEVERWSRRLIDIDAETRDKLDELEQAKREELDRFRNEHRLALRKADLAALQATYGEYENERVRLDARIAEARDNLRAARAMLDKTPPTIELRKAPSDDATWQALAAGTTSLQDLSGRVLVTQEVNPVHATLAAQVAQAEVAVGSLEPRRAQLETTLADMVKRIGELRAAIDLDEQQLQVLAAAADARIQRFRAERSEAKASVERAKEAAIQLLGRESKTRIGQADRDIKQERELFDQLATKFNEALIVKGQQNFDDVRLGAHAVPPDRPDSERVWQSTVAAVFAGLILGLGIAAFREVGAAAGPGDRSAGRSPDEARA